MRSSRSRSSCWARRAPVRAVSRRPPPCGFACQADKVVACVNECVTPVPFGGQCTPSDPCGPNGTCEITAAHPLAVCGPDGRCVDGLAFDEACLAGQTPCAAGLYCSNCGQPSFTGASPRCVLAGAQDRVCSVNGCVECAPGLDCVGPTGAACTEESPYGSCTCRLPCTTAADCPCNTPSPPYVCPEPGVAGQNEPVGYCTFCLGPLGGACNDQLPCCFGEECATITLPGGAPEQACCIQEGSPVACTSSDQCCPGSACSGGACLSTAGGACSTSQDCAGGLPCACGKCGLGNPVDCNVSPACCPADYGSGCGDLPKHSVAVLGCCVPGCDPCVSDSDCCRMENGGSKFPQPMCANIVGQGVKRCCLPPDAPVNGDTGVSAISCCSGKIDPVSNTCLSGENQGCGGSTGGGCQQPGGTCNPDFNANCCDCPDGNQNPCTSGVCPLCP